MTAKNMPRYIALADAAAVLDVDVSTLRRYIAAGRLPAYRVGARAIRLKLADVERLARPIPAGKST